MGIWEGGRSDEETQVRTEHGDRKYGSEEELEEERARETEGGNTEMEENERGTQQRKEKVTTPDSSNGRREEQNEEDMNGTGDGKKKERRGEEGWKIMGSRGMEKKETQRKEKGLRQGVRADERGQKTLSNSIVRKTRERRGRDMVEKKQKMTIDLKIKVVYKNIKREINPRHVMTELLKRLKTEDP